MNSSADIALIGLAVMGQNLILNMNDNGFVVCAYNRTTSKVDQFLANEAKGTKIVGAHSLEEMVAKLKKPRRVMMLVKGKCAIIINELVYFVKNYFKRQFHFILSFLCIAGNAVDQFIDALIPLLEPGDIIIDGGNSEYHDSIRRTMALQKHGLRFVGAGVSGGEEGARYGPSIMPGGDPEAWYVRF